MSTTMTGNHSKFIKYSVDILNQENILTEAVDQNNNMIVLSYRKLLGKGVIQWVNRCTTEYHAFKIMNK